MPNSQRSDGGHKGNRWEMLADVIGWLEGRFASSRPQRYIFDAPTLSKLPSGEPYTHVCIVNKVYSVGLRTNTGYGIIFAKGEGDGDRCGFRMSLHINSMSELCHIVEKTRVQSLHKIKREKLENFYSNPSYTQPEAFELAFNRAIALLEPFINKTGREIPRSHPLIRSSQINTILMEDIEDNGHER